MAIVSSSVTQEGAQRDGRKWTHEAHTDGQGLVYRFPYLAEAGLDVEAVKAARAAALSAQLDAEEAQANVAAIMRDGSLAQVTTANTTLAAIRTALRAAYAAATRTDAIMIGDFLSTLTNAQLQTLFGMTSGQVTTLRSNKLTPAASAAATIRAATGQ